MPDNLGTAHDITAEVTDMESTNTTAPIDEVMGEEVVQQTKLHDARVMTFPAEAQHEVPEVAFEVKGKGKGNEMQVEDENPFGKPPDAEPEAEGKGKGKEREIEDKDPLSPTAERQAEVHDAISNEIWSEAMSGIQAQDEVEGHGAVSGPSNEMAPPPMSLPQDPSSEAASIVASSVSNPMLEVDTQDNDFSDADSAISDIMQQGSTNSVRSSIYDYVEENGRTFHRYKEGKYILPNDEIEQNRLDLQHQMLLIMLDGKLHLAPIDPDLQYVLDVGTGTGIWAIDFAMKYPSASVIGTDLSPIQPEFIPANLQFEVDDAEDDWMFTRPFDFVHMRGTMTCFRDPRDILRRAYDALIPGGYLEMQDSIFPMHCHDDTLEGTALDVWGKACVEAGIKMGREWTNAPNYAGWMQELGFEDIKEKRFEVATSPWPKGRKQKELGCWWQADLLDALGGSITAFTRVLGWEASEVERLLVDVRKDIKNKAIHAFMPIYVIYGRKPKEPEEAVEA